MISRLTHPHICTLYDVGENEGMAFLAMELIEGETLAARLERGALTINEALTVAIDIGSALDTAHRAGIVHRDLKPGNIMLARSGPKLMDFGLAKKHWRRWNGIRCIERRRQLSGRRTVAARTGQADHSRAQLAGPPETLSCYTRLVRLATAKRRANVRHNLHDRKS